MKVFIARRFVYGLAVILLVSFFIFAMSRMAGDPRDLYVDEYTTAESYAAMGRAMGLDKPLVIQYLVWFGNALTGDFGRSLFVRTSALGVITERIPATMQLTVGGIHIRSVNRHPPWRGLGRQERDHLGLHRPDLCPLRSGPSGILAGGDADTDLQR